MFLIEHLLTHQNLVFQWEPYSASWQLVDLDPWQRSGKCWELWLSGLPGSFFLDSWSSQCPQLWASLPRRDSHCSRLWGSPHPAPWCCTFTPFFSKQSIIPNRKTLYYEVTEFFAKQSYPSLLNFSEQNHFALMLVSCVRQTEVQPSA